MVHRDLLHDGATWDATGYLNAGSIISISGSGSAAASSDGEDKPYRRLEVRVLGR